MRSQVAAIVLVPLVTLLVLQSTIQAQPPARSVWAGIYSEAQAARGKDRYSRQCAQCHGAALSGGETAPSLAGDDFMSRWDGQTVGDLFDRIRTTMPQSSPGSLSGEATADIIAFVLAANGLPVGKNEMSKEALVLKQIKLEAQKPAASKH